MFVSSKFLKKIDSDSFYNVRADFKMAMSEILEEFFSDKPLFSSDVLKLYYYDEYTLDTCISPKTTHVLYLEIDQPENIKKWEKKKNRHTFPELYYSLKKMKKDLLDYCVTQFDSNTLLWVDKFSVNFSINTLDEENDKVINNTFKLIPCISYKNENQQSGIMYYSEDTNDLIIEYPELAIKNFNKKNRECLGIYKDYVVMFKNMIKQIKNEKALPSEIYETILYNVPNMFFENFSIDNIRKIINYIRNSTLYNYKALDEQDFAFVTAYRPMNIVYVKHVIKKLESFIGKIK